MHLQLGISPEWLGTDRFDPEAELVEGLLTTAVRFAERTFGGTFGARFDTDEASGGGVVDVFCAPTSANKRSGKRVVSCRKAIQALKTQGAPDSDGKPPKPYAVLHFGTRNAHRRSIRPSSVA